MVISLDELLDIKDNVERKTLLAIAPRTVWDLEAVKKAGEELFLDVIIVGDEAKIREVASEHNVPLVAAPPLARALYFNAEIGDAIPEGLYRAVAQVLAYVYQLKQGPIYNREGEAPEMDLPIPDDLQHD